ncbi:PREDICTED: transcription cofactor vestigial-like protein 4 [Nanorana parkeri]|uniref:transcription cofactor vestigial-like protein 4 n=1 Tax=Nanorana parkeri TaxID=125878 RepID=UPI0008540B35|nr:PREDICTED: transcription cofactor vestigial-like protein 4 [Nanorana parkeri]
MAVSSLHYTMGISSGFKVYILEGQHSARNVDRLRPLTNHGIPVYPIKRKLSPEPPRSPKRLSTSNSQSRVKVTSSAVCQKPAPREPSSGPFSPKEFAHHPITLEHVLKRLIPERKPLESKEAQKNEQDQPLALVKRLERPSKQPIISSAMLQQNRPSVITCVSRPKPISPPATNEKSTPPQEAEVHRSPRASSPDVEEHFQRSLKSCATQQSLKTSPPHYIHSSVEDHFSKALGSKWLLIRAAADSASSAEIIARRQL